MHFFLLSMTPTTGTCSCHARTKRIFSDEEIMKERRERGGAWCKKVDSKEGTEEHDGSSRDGEKNEGGSVWGEGIMAEVCGRWRETEAGDGNTGGEKVV